MPYKKLILTCIIVLTGFVQAKPLSLTLSQAKQVLQKQPEKVIQAFQAQTELMPAQEKIEWLLLTMQAYIRKLQFEEHTRLAEQLFVKHWAQLTKQQRQRALKNLSYAAIDRRQYEVATRIGNSALTMADGPANKAQALITLGIVHFEFNNKEQAIVSNEKALEHLKNSKDLLTINRVKHNLAVMYFQQNDMHRASEMFRDVYVIQSKLGNINYSLTALSNVMYLNLIIEDWASWNKYYDLYKRRVKQANIKQIQASFEWMETYKRFKYEGIQPTPDTIASLQNNIEDIEQPTNYSNVKKLADFMNIPISERREKLEKEKENLHSPLLAFTCSPQK